MEIQQQCDQLTSYGSLWSHQSVK